MEIESQSLGKALYAKASQLKIPLSGTFELSPVCNFSCKMCYVRKTKQEVANWNRPQMKKEQWLELAKEAVKEGMLYLLLTGGEPFLWPRFRELYEELANMGLLISINTNGSLIDEDALQWLKKYPPKRVNITLYGASDESYEKLCGAKGVFGKVDHAIRSLKEAGISVKMNSSLTPSNVSDLEAIIAYGKSLDLPMEIATYMFPPVRRDQTQIGCNHRFTPEEYSHYRMEVYRNQYGEEVYENLLESVRQRSVPPPGLMENCVDPLDGKIRCRAGNASFWVTWDGYMTPCGMMSEPKTDLYEKDFKESWQQITEESDRIRLSGVCHSCPNREMCHTCAAVAQTETGSTEGIPTYLCESMEALEHIAEKSRKR